MVTIEHYHDGGKMNVRVHRVLVESRSRSSCCLLREHPEENGG